jgi:hypothetical protein
VTATVTTRSRSLCPDPEKAESSDNSQSKSLTLTRTPRKKYYLVGNSINKLAISKLPKKDAVLLYFDMQYNIVRNEILQVWKHHFGVGLIFGKAEETTKSF